MRRLATLLLLGATLTVGISSAATDQRWVTYRARHLTFPFAFSHPLAWRARYSGEVVPPYGPAHSRLIVALSTARLHRPTCHQVPAGGGATRTACDPLLTKVPPGGVYVEWWDLFVTPFPDPTLAQVPGNRTRIGGVLAKIVVDPTDKAAGTSCPHGITGSVQVYVAGNTTTTRRRRDEVYMFACADRPDFGRFFTTELLPMLRSVSFRRTS
jgi:hypothetical protein